MFEQATRLKLRFSSVVGELGAEDLWDLPLVSTRRDRACLDNIAIQLRKELRDLDEESFVTTVANTKKQQTQLRFDVVKHVIDVKIAEAKAKSDSAAVAEKRQKILQLIDDKRNEALGSKSIEELEADLASL